MDNFLDEVSVTKANSIKNSLWTEKYRPSKVDDYIGNEVFKKSISKYIKENDIPHLLLFSRESGTGKTTAAKLIASNIDADVMYINASDENSVENVRTKIKGFASTLGFKSIKIIILDEADFISTEGQAALRNLMETFSQSTRFILTCNYKDKILNALQSRSTPFEVIPPSKSDIARHLKRIIELEKVTFEPKDIAFLVNTCYPDVRKMLNMAQQSSTDGVLKIDEETIVGSDGKLQLVEILKSKGDQKIKFQSIRQLVADSGTNDFIPWYRFLYDSVDDFADGHIANVILTIADGEYREAFVVDKEINFSETIIKILAEIHS
jgi:replication factor C small subunit